MSAEISYNMYIMNFTEGINMKNIKRIAAVMLVLVMALALTACGKAKLDGAWTITGGTFIDGLVGEMGIEDLASVGLEIVFEFKDDGVFAVGMNMYGVSEVSEGTWEVDGDKVTMTVEGDPLEATFEVKGDKLTLTTEEGTIVFDKKD